MDTKLQNQLRLFAHSFTPSILVRRHELPATAAYLAITGVDHYHVEEITLDDEEWYQLVHATEPLWASPPPMQHIYVHIMV